MSAQAACLCLADQAWRPYHARYIRQTRVRLAPPTPHFVQLVLQNPAPGQPPSTHVLDGGRVRIGRRDDNEIVLDGATVSRTHAVLEFKDGEVWACNLSKNGTVLFRNNIEQKIHRRALEDGDELVIGGHRFLFETTLLGGLEIGDDSAPFDEDNTFVRQVDESVLTSKSGIQAILEEAEADEKGRGLQQIGAEDLARLREDSRKLRTVQRLDVQLAHQASLVDLLGRVLELVLDAMPGDRACALLVNPETGEPSPQALRYTSPKAKQLGEELEISGAIVSRAIRESAAIHASAGETGTMARMGLTDVLVVPFIIEERVAGALYVDRYLVSLEDLPTRALDMLETVAAQTSLYISQFLLLERVKCAEQERAHLERCFAPDVVRYLQEAGKDELVAQECIATILFSDIVGFTTWAERVGSAREVADNLNEYFGLMTDVVEEVGGIVDKFIGDGLMADFGVPRSNGPAEDARNALRAALRMLQELEALNQDRSPEEQIQIRIGINTGEVVAGMMGSAKRPEYSVLGDPVNTASRIEGLAGENTILIGRATWELTNDCEEFAFEDLGKRSVKGREEQVHVHRLTASGHEESPRSPTA